MKQSIVKGFRGMMAGFVLLTAAMPFVASAQSAASPDSGAPASRRIARPLASENGDLNSLLRTLEQTPGVSEVELDLVRRRIADLDRRRIVAYRDFTICGDGGERLHRHFGAAWACLHQSVPALLHPFRHCALRSPLHFDADRNGGQLLPLEADRFGRKRKV